MPNLRDYDAVREAFTWGSVRAELAMPGGLNIAYHALDRHVVEGRGNKLALRWLGKNGEKRDITYRELLLLSFYKGIGALIRARIAILHLWESPGRDPAKWPRRAAEYLAIATRAAQHLDR